MSNIHNQAAIFTSTTINPNTNITLPMATVQQLLGQQVTKTYTPKPTLFGAALMEAANHASDSSVMTTDQQAFRILSGNDAINCFGKLRPHMSLRPKKWSEMLLRTCPSPTQAYSKTASFYYHQAVNAGLMYALPLIYGSKRTRFRLTASGVVLLDYYADRWPDFAPFVKAYLPQKSREEIQSDSCDFIMGIEPEWLKKEKAKAEEAKQAYALAQALKEQASIRDYMAAQSSQTHTWPYTSAISTTSIGAAPATVWVNPNSNLTATVAGTQGQGWSMLSSALSNPVLGQSGVDPNTWSKVQAAAKRLAGKK
jgi:hypothetical protein